MFLYFSTNSNLINSPFFILCFILLWYGYIFLNNFIHRFDSRSLLKNTHFSVLPIETAAIIFVTNKHLVRYNTTGGASNMLVELLIKTTYE